MEGEDAFAFASEPQALLAAGFGQRTVDPARRAELLQLKFTTGEATPFPGIRRLAPGETLAIEDGRIIDRRRCPALPAGGPRRILASPPSQSDQGHRLGADGLFSSPAKRGRWRREATTEGAKPASPPQRPLSQGLRPDSSPASQGSRTTDVVALTQLERVLVDTVEHHLRADVPYGLFLSGGIDSAVLAVTMARITGRPITALTAGFPEGVDETDQARRVAKAVGAEHQVITLTPKDFWAQAPQVAACLDDPTTDAAALPTFALGAAAKGQLKVVLSGEGADEMFGGYGRYRRASWLGLIRRGSRSHGVFDRWPTRGLDGWRAGLAAGEGAAYAGGRSFVQGLQAMDCAQWLPNDLLTKADRCLMAHSVEGRTPFLDPVVADFAFRLPDTMKVRAGYGKWLLRQWLSKALPEAAAFAKKKGFNPPVGAWIAAGDPAVLDLVARQPGLAEVIDPVVARGILAEAAARPQAAWSLVFYALWHSVHVLGVDGRGGTEGVLAEAARRG